MSPQPSSPLQPQPLEASGGCDHAAGGGRGGIVHEHFTLVCLDARRKFLWARTFMNVAELPSYVLYCLNQPVVKTLSIQRVVPKEKPLSSSSKIPASKRP